MFIRTRLLIFSLFVPLLSALVFAHPGEAQKLGYLDQQIEQYPDRQANYIKRGAIYRHLGLLERAQSDFEQAIQLGDLVNVQYELGRLYVRQSRERQAISSFSAYLQAFPNAVKALEERAKAYQRMANYSLALVDYRQLMSVSPALNPGQYLAIVKLQKLAGEDALQQLNTLDLGLEIIGNNISLQRKAIELELRLGNTPQAIKRQTSLKHLTGKTPAWHLDMAKLQLSVGDFVSTKKHLDQARSGLEKRKHTPALSRMLAAVNRLTDQLEISKAD